MAEVGIRPLGKVLLAGIRVPSPIGVVVPGQHEVDVVLLEQRTPGLPDAEVVAPLVKRVDGVVEHHHRPRLGVVREHALEPGTLDGQTLGVGDVAVEGHETRVLVVDVVDGALESVVDRAITCRTVVGEGELVAVLARQDSVVLVVTRRRQKVLRAERVREGLVDLTPLRIRVRVVDEVTRLHDEVGVGTITERVADDPRGVVEDAVLHIPEVDERVVAALGGGSLEVLPLAEVGAIADSVHVGGARRETREGRRVGHLRVAEVGRLLMTFLRREGEDAARVRLRGERAVLHNAVGDGGAGAPCDHLLGRRVLARGERDAIGQTRRRPALRVGQLGSLRGGAAGQQ